MWSDFIEQILSELGLNWENKYLIMGVGTNDAYYKKHKTKCKARVELQSKRKIPTLTDNTVL